VTPAAYPASAGLHARLSSLDSEVEGSLSGLCDFSLEQDSAEVLRDSTAEMDTDADTWLLEKAVEDELRQVRVRVRVCKRMHACVCGIRNSGRQADDR